MVANVVTDLNAELDVCARISSNPEFSIPVTSTEEIVVSSVGTIRETIFGALESIVEQGSAVTKGFKFFTGAVSSVPFTVIDVAMSYDDEGIMQAVVTATTAAGVSVAAGVGLTILAGSTSLPATASAIGIGIFCGGLNFALGKLLDGVYDYGEQVVSLKDYDEAKNSIVFETSIADINDIKNAIFPLNDYLNASIEDIEKIQIEQAGEGISNIYTVKNGDTIYDISGKTGVSYDELKELNPWLEDRFSDDGEYVLIKVGEKLVLPDVSGYDIANFEDSGNYLFMGYMEQAEAAPNKSSDPVILDLDRDGVVSTTSVEDGVYFDHDRDGFVERSAWVGGDDGMLVYDKNGNGVIDDGNEVFGDNYVKSDGSVASSGFDALRDLDSNNDGKISSEDLHFGDLRLLKSDGSMVTLGEAGVQSIYTSVEYGVETDCDENKVVRGGEYRGVDGEWYDMAEVNFAKDSMDTIVREELEVSEDIEVLPEIANVGVVYSLHQAMMRDESGELKELVEDFVGEQDEVLRKELVEDILYKWTDADSVEVGSRGDNYDAQKLHILEQFMGRIYDGASGATPNDASEPFLMAAYDSLVNAIYSSLEAQTHLKDIYNLFKLEYDSSSDSFIYNVDDVIEYLDSKIEQNSEEGKKLVVEFTQTMLNLNLKDSIDYDTYYNHFVSLGDDFKLLIDMTDKIVVNGDDNDNDINGSASNEAIFAGGGDDTIYSRQGDDLVYGGDGDDYIDTCQDNDIIYGEGGNDTIIAGVGDDIVYGGDGNDIIDVGYGNNYVDGGDGDDEIEFGAYTTNTIIGGKGNDTFRLSLGSKVYNTYIYNKGDGCDSIYNNDGENIIQFGEGIARQDLSFYGEGNDIIINFVDSDDFITIKNFAGSDAWGVDLKFSDGSKKHNRNTKICINFKRIAQKQLP